MSKDKEPKEEKDYMLKRHMEDLLELERYVKEINTFLPLPFCLITRNNIIIDVNSALVELTGYSEFDLRGQKVDTLFYKKQDLKKILKEIHAEKEIKAEETEVATRTGDILTVSVSASPRRDHEGEVEGYFIALSDITELKKLQDNLEDKVKERTKKLNLAKKEIEKSLNKTKLAMNEVEAERNKTASIIANFVDPVIVVDNDYRIMLFNPAAKDVFGIADKDIGKRTTTKGSRFSFNDFQDIINTDYRVSEIETDANLGTLIEEVIIDVDEIKKDTYNPFDVGSRYNLGERIYKVFTAQVCDEEKNCYGRMKIFTDITREKMIDKMKSEFISVAAHQLRTPLSAIKWSIKLILEGDMGPINKEQEKVLMGGYTSNERVIILINDMLDVSRIEEGKYGFNFDKNDIVDAINIVLSKFEPQIENKKIKLTYNKPSKVPTLYFDKDRILMVLENIIENAISYTPVQGSININLEIKPKKIIISIKDNGVGIPEEDQDKLFTKFFRAANVVRLQTEGSGLGLYITKNIIQNHGGKIDIKSEESKGTEVIISLPRTR